MRLAQSSKVALTAARPRGGRFAPPGAHCSIYWSLELRL